MNNRTPKSITPSSSKAFIRHREKTPLSAISTRERIPCSTGYFCGTVPSLSNFSQGQGQHKQPSHTILTTSSTMGRLLLMDRQQYLKARWAPGSPALTLFSFLCARAWCQYFYSNGQPKQKRNKSKRLMNPTHCHLKAALTKWDQHQCSDLMGLALPFQELQHKLTSLFGVSGFEHGLSYPPLPAVAWPSASHVAPDDYAEHLWPSDAQLEINTDKNPQIRLQNFTV